MSHPLVGRAAPDFTLRDQHGTPVTLSQYRGSTVLLIFVPFAFSDLCTHELVELKNSGELAALDPVTVLVVSCDSTYTLNAWGASQDYEGELLSDYWPHGDVARDYSVFNPTKGIPVRASFIIGPDGDVTWAVVNSTTEARDVRDYVAALTAS